MTFSIVASDPRPATSGSPSQSKFLAVGAVVPWARAGVGAVATQALANVALRAGRARRSWPAARPPPRPCAALTRPTASRPAAARRRRRPRARRDPHRPACFAVGRRADRPGLRRPGQHPGRGGGGRRPGGHVPRGRPAAAGAARRVPRGRRCGRRRPARPPVGGAPRRAGGRRLRRRQRPLDRPAGRRPRRPDRRAGRLVDLHRLYFDRPAAEPTWCRRRGDGRGASGALEALGAGPGGRFGAVYAPMSGRGRRGRGTAIDRGAATAAANWDALAGGARRLDGRQEPGGTDGCTGWIDRRVLAILREAGPADLPDWPRWNTSAGSSARSPRTSTSSPIRARARRSRSTPPRRAWPGSPTSSPPATGRSS